MRAVWRLQVAEAVVVAADGHRLGHAGLGDVARTLDAVGLQGDLLAGPLRASTFRSKETVAT